MSVFDQYKRISEGITDDQRDLLDFIWHEYLKTSEWPRITNVICEIGSQSKVNGWLKELGEEIVAETYGREGKKVLRLTFLGSLLTSSHAASIEILRKFLIHLKMQILERGVIEFTIKRSHIVEALQINKEEERILLRLSDALGHYWGAFNGTDIEWSFQPWDKAVELLDIEIQDMNKYILSVALPDQNQEAEFKDEMVESDSTEIPDDYLGSGDVVQNDNMKGKFKFDVALSFAGEQREYVEEVFDYLKKNKIQVFYDKDKEIALWGEDLAEYFDDVFRVSSEYCVMFISREYEEKSWTIHERRSALARALEERRTYVLPARFDDTDLPGLRPTIKYIELSEFSPVEFAKIIIKKISLEEKQETDGLEKPTPETLNLRVKEDTLRNLAYLLLELKQYASEVEQRSIHPGSDQLCEAYENGCDSIRSFCKEPAVIALGIAKELEELSLISEQIGTYEFYMGQGAWKDFTNLVDRATTVLDEILMILLPDIFDESTIMHRQKKALDSCILDIEEIQSRLNRMDSEQVYKRIAKYQEELSQLGSDVYSIGILEMKLIESGIGDEISEIGRMLHLIEATDGELDPWAVTDQFNSLEDIPDSSSKCNS